jgi:hypothetical protein
MRLLERAMSVSENAIVITNGDLKIEFYNPSFVKLLCPFINELDKSEEILVG